MPAAVGAVPTEEAGMEAEAARSGHSCRSTSKEGTGCAVLGPVPTALDAQDAFPERAGQEPSSSTASEGPSPCSTTT